MLFRRFFSNLARGRQAPKPVQGEVQGFVLVLMRSSIGRHLEVFRELIELVACGLGELGYSSVTMVNEFAPAGRHIVFCPHLLRAQDVQRVPASTILYNFEPLDPPVFDSVGTFLADYAPRFRVWDYSAANVHYLSRLGCQARHVPVGYAPLLTRIARVPDQDIDVLFYGDISARRARILDRLRETGVNVVIVSDLYGAERDALIARAKVVLNIHNDDGIKALETPRVFYLLANRKAVVTEVKADVQIEPDLRCAMALSPYDSLVQTCVDLVGDDKRRAMLEQAGFACMQARNEAKILAAALQERR
jgi:hypothetical protein